MFRRSFIPFDIVKGQNLLLNVLEEGQRIGDNQSVVNVEVDMYKVVTLPMGIDRIIHFYGE